VVAEFQLLRRSAIMTTEKTRVCEWCKQSIPEEAIKCSFCHKWREDIDKDRKRVMVAFAGGMGLILLAVGLIRGSSRLWCDSSPDWAIAAAATSGHGVGGDYFSIIKFLSSGAGWLLIVMVICAIGFLIAADHCQKVLKQKTGSKWPV
jgi:predicted nucleic acid-binding Zn ribbon protein